MSDSFMDLGPVLREARSGTGTSQQDPAKRTGLAVRTIAELESGRGDLASLDAVVQALGFHLVGLPRGTSWGERCKLLRSRSGLSLTRLAEQAGVSVPAIARLEKGEVVHVQTLSRVLRVLAPKARRRQAQTTALGLDGGRDMRFTPVAMLSKLVDPVGPFDLDPCGHPDSPVEARECFFGGPDDDGLKRD
jgi:transcriptional regulator with XRE-family HTH domain